MAWRAGLWPAGRMLHTPALECTSVDCNQLDDPLPFIKIIIQILKSKNNHQKYCINDKQFKIVMTSDDAICLNVKYGKTP